MSNSDQYIMECDKCGSSYDLHSEGCHSNGNSLCDYCEESESDEILKGGSDE